MSSVDLHVHSHYSEEGELSVLDLIQRVEASEIQLASIVDPNVVASAKEVRAYKNHSKIQWIEAIEVHAQYQQHEVSVIGYGIDPSYAWFQDLETVIQKAHHDTLQARLDALNKSFGVDLTPKHFVDHDPHRILHPQRVAELVLLLAQKNKLDAFNPYLPKGSRYSKHHRRFMDDYMRLGQPAYVEIALPSLVDVVNHIHQAGGLAVLAHPGLSLKEDKSRLNQMIHIGLDGIEAYSPYHTEFQNVFYVEYALLRKLLITCGSDFYGAKKPQLKLGLTHCPLDATSMLKQFRLRGLEI